MPFLSSPRWFALGSRRHRRRPGLVSRHRSRLTPVVASLEERQLLTTPTLTSVSASATNLVFGQAEVLTATVVTDPPGGGPVTGGTMIFQSGTTPLGSANLTNGSATLSATLSAGTYSVTATYSGTSTFGGSTSATSAGSIFTLAGSGTFGNSVTSVGMSATTAELANPFGVAVGPTGTIYVADTFNNEIDSISPATGLIRVIAGSGTFGYHDDTSALLAEFASPRGLALDATGRLLYIADRDNNVIRQLDLVSGAVTTVAGTGSFGDGGTGIAATSADLGNPTAVAVSPNGQTLFIADTFNDKVRQVNLTSGVITTIAGTGMAGFSGDGNLATSAELFDPSGVAVDSGGNVYVSDSDNEVVRKITASTQVITTIAGIHNSTGTGFSGNNGPATSAQLATPWGLALNASGTILYIADRDNNAIRALNLGTGILTTFAGTGPFGSNGAGGPATSATLSSPRSVEVDATGNVFVADTLGNQIRMVARGTGTTSVTIAPFAGIAPGFTTIISNGVPTGVGRHKAQGIVLVLNRVTNPSAARLASSYRLSTPPNRAGHVKRIKIRRVTFDSTTDVVRLFPAKRLQPRKTYQLVIMGQGPDVTLQFNGPGVLSERT